MENKVIKISKQFWNALEHRDTKTMRALSDEKCYFVHIGGNCDLDKEMRAFDIGDFQPTKVVLNKQEVHEFNDTSIVISDVDYTLLLEGKETTHHFAVTEVYQKQNQDYKLIQFTFTALVY
jgi:hypothetical protein